MPLIIPGSMGTASYILVGGSESEKLSFSSSAHGAGRVMSRSAAHKKFTLDEIEKDLEKKGILIDAGSKKGLVEEYSSVYKNIDDVIGVSSSANLASPVAKLRPLAVIIG